MGAYSFKSLSPKPSKEYIWDKKKQYEAGQVVWYDGIFYYFARPSPAKSVIGTAPNLETGSFKSVSFNFNVNPPDTEQTKTMRSWIMIDPRTLFYDRSTSKLAAVKGPAAAATSAAIRGIPALSVYPDPFVFPLPKDGEPAYYGNYGNFLSNEEDGGNLTQNWLFYNVYPRMSANYGLGNTIYATYTDTNTPPQSHTVSIGSNTPTNNYMLLAGGMIYSDEKNVTFKGDSILPQFVYDNVGKQQSAITAETTIPDTQVVNDSIPGALTGTKYFSVGTVFSNQTDPITMTMINGLLGTKISYRCVLAYYNYTEVKVPPPYITIPPTPDTTKYYRTGGTLILKSGNGTTTPRVYEWTPPYNPLEYREVFTGDFTLSSSHNEYSNAPFITQQYSINNEYIKVRGGMFTNGDVYYKTLNPVQP